MEWKMEITQQDETKLAKAGGIAPLETYHKTLLCLHC